MNVLILVLFRMSQEQEEFITFEQEREDGKTKCVQLDLGVIWLVVVLDITEVKFA